MTASVLVTAGIIVKDNLVLCARRATGRSLAGYWEFPGGKVEVGESFIDCLRRELIEELSLSVKGIRYFHENTHVYPTLEVRLLAYIAEPDSSLKIGKDHDKLIWLPFDKLTSLVWSAADVPIVDKLVNEGLS